ncbi:MAG TPA: hypothetical protein VFR02_08215, partial [bacterium]|nr:hypothetical protein [bacterium]
AGFRYFVLPQWAADFGASFRSADAKNGALQSVDFHTGLSFFVNSPFKNADKMVWAGGGVTIMQPVTITATDQGAQSLSDIARDEYGDPDLYPLIIDANFADKDKPLILPPGIQLIIPQHPTGEMMAAAHVKAKTPVYKKAADTFRMPELDNLQYRLEPAQNNQETMLGGQRSELTFRADSLWDIAARPDVYGDPELYPLLVDANFSRLSDPLLLKPGAHLVIPRHPSEREKRMARVKAWTVDYIRWRGVDVTEGQYREWRKERGLPPVDDVTGEVLQPQPADEGN